jgi:hypothetical protein
LLRRTHHFIPCVSIYLTISLPFIKFCNSLLHLFLHLSLH